MRCAEVRAALPAFAGEGYASLALRRHLASCSACAAEMARYERLRDALADLREVTASPPAGLLASLEAIPREAGALQTLAWRAGGVLGHVARNRAAYLGGLGLVAGATATALWRSRRLATA
jgi:anti-sigma factor RsiW